MSCSESGAAAPPENDDSTATEQRAAYALAIHGGAGVIERESMSAAYEAEVRAVLAQAVKIGEDALKAERPAEEVVVEVISFLEDQPQFNAGKGAVFTYEGDNELDASIMRGKDLQAGAVSGVKGIQHPIQLARDVMDHSVHVMLSGKGAEEFASTRGYEVMEPSYFHTQLRYDSWKRARQRADQTPQLSENGKFGTVGCVALDRAGNLAAGTSTGGMTLKRYGRIGDSPIVGAGVYANNSTCAVSATGHGEYFIRYAVAHDISARMQYGGSSLKDASESVINGVLKDAGGEGGIIAVDHLGNVSLPFNSAGMYRGYATPTVSGVAIFGDEEL